MANVFQFQPFSRKQRKVLNWWTKDSPVKDYDGIIADGSIRSGKSISMSLSYVLWAMESYQFQNFGMAGKTISAFRRNVLVWLQLMLMSRGYTTEHKRADNLLIVRRKGVENYFYIFGGKDERSQDLIQGITLAGMYFDEVALMPESFVNQATGRCSVEGAKLWFNCNPASPNHWFKTDWVDLHAEKNLLYLHFTMDDNLSLSEKVKSRYRSLYSGVFYDRYIRGLWALAEGLIFQNYAEALKPPPAGDPDDYVLSIDYGTMNAFAALLFAKFGGTWYAVREYYYSGRDKGVQKTDEQYAQDIDTWLMDITPGQRIETIIDPSAASFIALLRKRGHRYKVIKADNAVLDGIRETANALDNGYVSISPACKNWREEAAGYVWDKDSLDDRPVKENDHCLVGETLVNTKDGAKPISELVGTSGEVWSYNTKTGVTELKPYHDCKLTQEKAEIYEIETEDGRFIRCTGEHPILTKRGYVSAKDLLVSDRIIDVMISFVGIKAIRKVGKADVYNMEVDGNHNFSIEGGLIVHNCMDATRYFVKTKRIIKKALRRIS